MRGGAAAAAGSGQSDLHRHREQREAFPYLAHTGDPANEFITRDVALVLMSNPVTCPGQAAAAVADRTLETAPGTQPGEQAARQILHRVRAHLDTVDQP